VQVFYPDEFNGCYAACPDPVDYRAFCQVNIYEDMRIKGSNKKADVGSREKKQDGRDQAHCPVLLHLRVL
jgi:hypothetical protein